MKFKILLPFFMFSLIFSQQICAGETNEYLAKNSSSMKQENQKGDLLYKITKRDNPSFYLGFGGTIGGSLTRRLDSTSFTEKQNQQDVQLHTIRQNLPHIGFMGLAGYQMNPIVGFEAYYSQSAWDYKTTDRFLFTADRLNESHEQITKRQELNFGPRVTLSLPIHKYFSPYIMAGFLVQYFHQISYYTNVLNAPTLSTDRSSAWSFMASQGFGLRSQLTKNFGLRLEVYVPYYLDAATRANLIAYVSF